MKAWKIGLIIVGVVGLAMASRLLEAAGGLGITCGCG